MADKNDNTVNYSIVAEETKNCVRDQSTNLIETLADQLATHLLKTFRIQKIDRKSTRLNSSHRCISYAVFCLKKKIRGADGGEDLGYINDIFGTQDFDRTPRPHML